jgi:tRNA(Ile)-lysidine synthase
LSRASLITIVRRAFLGPCAPSSGGRVLVAVSGGGDSMALMHAAARVAEAVGIRVSAHGVDHGLRAGAAAELDTAEAFARTLGLAFGRTRLELKEGGNLQARARNARYSALQQAARDVGACAVATGHHADDRAETVMLRLLRGSGPRGLAVMPPRSPIPIDAGQGSPVLLLRPLLAARRSDIRAHLERHHVPFHEDPSNTKRRFLRSRVRFELMPLLEELSPGAVAHLNALADQLHNGSTNANAVEEAPTFPGLILGPGNVISRALCAALSALPRQSIRARVRVPHVLFATERRDSPLAVRYDRAQGQYVLESESDFSKEIPNE